ncbi:MAG: DUF3108 domain-containing protein [Bacteroidetes bacterium]|nr:DUF3108 domain-containing protein [Bacteroidota bacterium]
MRKARLNTRSFILILIFAAAFLSSRESSAQQNHFDAGEELSYEVFYHLWGMWVGAGSVTFSIQEEIFRGQICFRFQGFGKTHKRYDWFFEVRDTYSAYSAIDGLKPQRFTRDVNEGSFYFYEQNLYDHSSQKIYSVLKEKERPIKVDTVQLIDGSFDVLTMMYHYRNLDFDSYEIGQRIPINMVIDRETHDLYLKYLGRDTYDHDEFGELQCHVIAPLLVAGSIFREGERMKVWFTADQNRMPIYVETDIRIGSIRSEIKKIKGLKYPLGG